MATYDKFKGHVTLQTVGGFPHCWKRMSVLGRENSCTRQAKGPSSSAGTLRANYPWMLAETPSNRIHVDQAIQVIGTNWLVLIDAYSKYPCLFLTNGTATNANMDLLITLRHSYQRNSRYGAENVELPM